MCLTINHNNLVEHGRVIEKPITCWKVMKKIKPVWYKKWFEPVQYLSPFRKSEYVMGNTVTLFHSVTARPRFAYDENAIDKVIVSHWEVEEGLHSLVNFANAQEVRDDLMHSHKPSKKRITWVIVECEIPSGSLVFDGFWFNGIEKQYKSYASSSIVMLSETDYEFDWLDILKFGTTIDIL